MVHAARFLQCMKHKKCLEKKFGFGARIMLSQNIANGVGGFCVAVEQAFVAMNTANRLMI